MVEVYNEAVYDLLVSPDEGHEKLVIQKRGKDIVVPVSPVEGGIFRVLSMCKFPYSNLIVYYGILQ